MINATQRIQSVSTTSYIGEKEAEVPLGMRATISCAHYGKPGHTARECWTAHPELKSEGRNKMKCFGCQKVGHLKWNCPERGSRNRQNKISYNTTNIDDFFCYVFLPRTTPPTYQKHTSIIGILKGNSLHTTTVSQHYRNTKVRKMDRSTTEKKGKGKNDTTKYNCPHGKRKTYCELCGGNGLCEHKTNKYTCAKCKDSDICEHNVRKYECTEGC
ncbi:MAG: hypothetical protein GY775_20770, partial [Candidatus Scalindua sp.]|nr:hypothetical protein [Candidatus Scalindua sp.]